jgi:NTP pyrophosphatase (non-canonical NTP hydrolase)
MQNSEVIKKLASQGLQHQLDQTQEECAELIAAISKYRRRGDIAARESLVEEIADVYIMLSQLELFFGQAKLKKEINLKLMRSKERLENGTI